MINRDILKDLCEVLEQHQITWGIGGSCLLQLYGLYNNPQDLDLWVQPSDIGRLRGIFIDFPEMPTEIPIPKEFHYKINYRNLEVDFIACFITKPNQYQFTYNINPQNIRMLSLDDIQVPCTYLEDWYIIYRLLNKDDKANLIKRIFKYQQIDFDERAIEQAINSNQVSLPIRIKKDVLRLIDDATQTYIRGWMD